MITLTPPSGKLEAKLWAFEPFINFSMTRKNYETRIAETGDEVLGAMRLRHQVFYKEMLGKQKPSGLDADPFDFICDHLIIRRVDTGETIGTYRLNPSSRNRRFYAAGEFWIANIQKLPGIKLEVGRACIHPEHRNGLVITLLWKGMMEYFRRSGASWLFGCSSLATTDSREAVDAYRRLAPGHLSPKETRVFPLPGKGVPHFNHFLKLKNRAEVAVEPSSEIEKRSALLLAYLRAGAKICGKPVLDRMFRCVDFFTLLDARDLSDSYEKKFFSAKPLGVTEAEEVAGADARRRVQLNPVAP
ncbi:MAG: GNAT family N-acetyltransferase [Spirochaetia bacterium]|nr:GNAT family N-acetyltransferase [Spirochaetia bacterium]